MALSVKTPFDIGGSMGMPMLDPRLQEQQRAQQLAMEQQGQDWAQQLAQKKLEFDQQQAGVQQGNWLEQLAFRRMQEEGIGERQQAGFGQQTSMQESAQAAAMRQALQGQGFTAGENRLGRTFAGSEAEKGRTFQRALEAGRAEERGAREARGVEERGARETRQTDAQKARDAATATYQEGEQEARKLQAEFQRGRAAVEDAHREARAKAEAAQDQEKVRLLDRQHRDSVMQVYAPLVARLRDIDDPEERMKAFASLAMQVKMEAPELAREILDMALKTSLPEGEAGFFSGAIESAEGLFREAAPYLPGPGGRVAAEILNRTGGSDEAERDRQRDEFEQKQAWQDILRQLGVWGPGGPNPSGATGGPGR